MKKNILPILLFSLFIFFSSSYLFVPPTHAGVFDDIKNNLGEFNENAGLPANENLADTIVTIINIVLGFLALVFVILIIYGGFTYMTAGGTAEKTKKATDILKNSVIGVIIIVLSGIFVNYILDTLLTKII